jgi:RNA polymerase sigma factor (sigma-70 family)
VTNETDEELMIKYGRSDDVKSFEELYRRYSPRVYSYLLKNCWDSKDAEEIHQHVFLKVHHQRNRYDPKFPFTAWLFTIVKRTMIDDFRKTRTRGKTLEQTENKEAEESTNLGVTDHLEDSQKKILELRYIEEWSFEEIANELKVNAATVRKRISRLLKQLRGDI